jgi:hypothetical protein
MLSVYSLVTTVRYNAEGVKTGNGPTLSLVRAKFRQKKNCNLHRTDEEESDYRSPLFHSPQLVHGIGDRPRTSLSGVIEHDAN